MWQLLSEHQHALPAEAYYGYRLYRAEMRSLARLFLEFDMLARVERAILDANHADRALLSDKRKFMTLCDVHGVPTPPILAWFESGHIETHAALPRADLFSKPNRLAHGWGATIWRYVGDDRWSTGDDVWDEGQLLHELARRSQQRPQILQQRIVMHENVQGLSSGGASTVRVVTLRFPEQPAEHLMSAFKMTVNGKAVDNFLGGGLVAPVESDTGVLGAAVQRRYPEVRHTVHPDTRDTLGTYAPARVAHVRHRDIV